MLLDKIEAGKIDPSFIITHRVRLADAPEMYKTVREHGMPRTAYRGGA